VGAAEFLRHVARTGFRGEIVVEINTRKAGSREEREKDLAESLEFAREHFSSSLGPTTRGASERREG
jgi:sugar phosphate isomerase/epimerase